MAQTGAVFGMHCHPSQADALDAYYSQAAPAQVPGATSYLAAFVKEAGGWQIKQYSVDGAGILSLRSTTAAPVFTFPACDPSEPFLDGVTIGWGIATAMVAAAAIVFLKRGARGG